MDRIVYFDNAATTWKKPRTVTDAVVDAMEKCGNSSRGAHKPALAASEIVYECREALAGMFDASPETVVFTMNATEALNMAIKGLAWRGCHILIDNLCHNAVRRPVIALAEKLDCTYSYYDATLTGDALAQNIESKIQKNTAMLIATHQCNISSDVLSIDLLGRICKAHGIHFVVDGSQSAGHLPISVRGMSITALCLPGHKGLYGPMGVGALISADGVHYDTLIEGGAGISSLDAGMPDELPERLEAGTAPIPAIAGLLAGVRFTERTGVGEIHSQECKLSNRLIQRLSSIPRVELYGDTAGSNVSFNIAGVSPSEVGSYLSERGICVRTGYHCAPVAHRTLGSGQNGSIRVSFSYMNKLSEVERLADILREI